MEVLGESSSTTGGVLITTINKVEALRGKEGSWESWHCVPNCATAKVGTREAYGDPGSGLSPMGLPIPSWWSCKS